MTAEITSRDNPRVKEARRVAEQPQFRKETGLFFAEGKRLCFDLAAAMQPEAVFFTRDFLDANPETEKIGGVQYLVSDGVAEKLSDTKTTQGLFCLFRRPEAKLSAERVQAGVLVCEALQDPANTGAMVRSAAALGLGAVVFGTGSADPFSPKALRASVGAVAKVCVMTDADVLKAVALLKESGSTVYAAALHGGAVPLPETQVKRPFVLLVGNEGAGLSEKAAAAADARVYIPMRNGVESMNAAAAAAVLLYAFGAW